MHGSRNVDFKITRSAFPDAPTQFEGRLVTSGFNVKWCNGNRTGLLEYEHVGVLSPFCLELNLESGLP